MGKVLAAFLAFSVPLLAACSGGGGGSSVATTPPPAPVTPSSQTKASGIPLNLQPPSTPVTYQAAAITAVGAGRVFNNIAVSAAGQGATVTLSSDSSGNWSHLVIPAGGIDVPLDGGLNLTSPATLDFTFQLGDVFESSSNTIAYSLSQVAAGQGLTSSAYGIWASVWKGPPADAGVFAFGNLTPAASVPATGSANFNGFTIGMGGGTDGNAFVVKGNVQIIANFATQSVTTNLTNFNALNVSYRSTAKASLPDLTGTSTLVGNAYAGPISGGGVTGSINGNFYGSAAQETAGVWRLSDGNYAWIGSFGAK